MHARLVIAKSLQRHHNVQRGTDTCSVSLRLYSGTTYCRSLEPISGEPEKDDDWDQEHDESEDPNKANEEHEDAKQGALEEEGMKPLAKKPAKKVSKEQVLRGPAPMSPQTNRVADAARAEEE